jgi:ABC-type nitrate/sulfonate/bicarbonate transport system substrate-binding protein
MQPRPLQTFVALMLISLLPSILMAQTDPVRVVYYPPWNISKLPMYLARETGVFERNGLTIAWTDPGSNDKLLATLKKGDADIAVVSANHIVHNNATGGAAMILIGNTGYNYSAFFAGASIKSAADLKGEEDWHRRAGQHARSIDASGAEETRHRSRPRCDAGPLRRRP